MVGRLLEGYWRAQLSRLTADAYMGEEKNVADAELGDTLDERARAWREADPSQDADLQTRTRRAVEHRLLRHGDDGLLEYLHETSEQARDPDFGFGPRAQRSPARTPAPQACRSLHAQSSYSRGSLRRVRRG